MTFAMFFNTLPIVVGLALSMLTLSARAERAPKIQVLDAKVLGNQPETEHQQKVSLARKLIRDKNYEAASALLETLTEQEDVSPVVVNLLLNCYDHLGYYVKSEAIVQRLVDRNPQNYTNRLRLAEVFVKQKVSTEKL
jgi:thioredoxin-like negative regulator of GroEL